MQPSPFLNAGQASTSANIAGVEVEVIYSWNPEGFSIDKVIHESGDIAFEDLAECYKESLREDIADWIAYNQGA